MKKSPVTDVISGALAVESDQYQPIPNGSAVAPPSPSVETIRDGDIIRALRVRCSCGHVMQIACDYHE